MTRLSIRWYTHSVTRPHTHTLTGCSFYSTHLFILHSFHLMASAIGVLVILHDTTRKCFMFPDRRLIALCATPLASYLRHRPVWQYVIYSRQFSQKIKISFFFLVVVFAFVFSKHVLNSTTVNNVSRALFNSCCCCCCCCYFCFCCFEFFSLFFWLLLI